MGPAGNSRASHAWKGSIVLKKAGLILLTVFMTSGLHALDFSINGEIWKTRTTRNLNELSYPVPFGTDTVSGISFDELFPAVYEAWQLEIFNTDGSSLRLADPDLGDGLGRIYLIGIDKSWSVLYKNRLFPAVSAINIAGEPLENDPLEIWINWEGTEELRTEISRYAALHDIEIKVAEVPKPDSKLISVSQANGSIPDIIMVQSSYIDTLSRSGCIQNLDYMYPPGLVPQGKDAFSLDGKTWGVPFYYDAQMIFYNPEIISAPERDWTLADFETACREALGKGKIPAAWNSYSASFLIPFQMAFGKTRLVETDGSIIIDDKPTLEALEYILKLQNSGLMQPMERDAMTSLFISGEAAMIISASYSIPHFQKLGIPFKTAPLPVNSGTGIRVSPLLDFKAFAVAKRSKNTTAAEGVL